MTIVTIDGKDAEAASIMFELVDLRLEKKRLRANVETLGMLNEAYVEEIAELHGAQSAADKRLLDATEKIGVPPAGCYTADLLADEILGLRIKAELWHGNADEIGADSKAMHKLINTAAAMMLKLHAELSEASAELQSARDENTTLRKIHRQIYLLRQTPRRNDTELQAENIAMRTTLDAIGGEGWRE